MSLRQDVHLFNLECGWPSTVVMKQNVYVLSHVTGAHLEAFWLGWQEMDKCFNDQIQGSLMMGHH
jgi:hypothetical protein